MFSVTIMPSLSSSSRSPVIGMQISPRPCVAMKLTRLRRHLVGGHDQVALVLTVLVVDDQQDATLADLLDAFLDRGEGHVVPLSASDRCRYLPITSVSMFTA